MSLLQMYRERKGVINYLFFVKKPFCCSCHIIIYFRVYDSCLYSLNRVCYNLQKKRVFSETRISGLLATWVFFIVQYSIGIENLSLIWWMTNNKLFVSGLKIVYKIYWRLLYSLSRDLRGTKLPRVQYFDSGSTKEWLWCQVTCHSELEKVRPVWGFCGSVL